MNHNNQNTHYHYFKKNNRKCCCDIHDLYFRSPNPNTYATWLCKGCHKEEDVCDCRKKLDEKCKECPCHLLKIANRTQPYCEGCMKSEKYCDCTPCFVCNEGCLIEKHKKYTCNKKCNIYNINDNDNNREFFMNMDD
jgi:hypothetical protein